MQPERVSFLTNHLQFDLEKLLNNQYENWLISVPESQSAISEALSSIDPGLALEFETFYKSTTTRLPVNKLLRVMDTAVPGDIEEKITSLESLDRLSINVRVLAESKEVFKEDSQITLRDEEEDNTPVLQETQKKTTSCQIPRFYFPYGAPTHTVEKCDYLMRLVKNMFVQRRAKDANFIGLTEDDAVQLSEILGVPKYLTKSLFNKLASRNATDPAFITLDSFTQVWPGLYQKFNNEEAFAFGIIKDDASSHIVPENLDSIAEYVVQTHPGLEFLTSMPNFQSKYVETVTSRIFYGKRHNWTQKMTLSEFRDGGILDMIKRLEAVEDMNTIHDAFSYKHFYVIYCRFWELDQDSDMFIDEFVLRNYERGALTSRIMSRVIHGCGQGRPTQTLGRISYKEFIPFIISVEDKKTTPGIEYWFRCLDLDGDGVISLHELHYFWEEQFERMIEQRMSDPWQFDDFVCSLFDLVQPETENFITLRDLKRCGSPALFFDMIFDLRMYEHQLRRIDPLFREQDQVFIMTESGEKILLGGWNKYAHRAYNELSAEDSQEQQEMDDLEELLDARDNFMWSDKDEDFDDMRLVDQDETSELSDIEEEEVMESIDLRV